MADDAEGLDLVDALAVRGIDSRLVRDHEQTEVEIASTALTREAGSLEVTTAIESWLDERRRPQIRARLAKRVYTLRPQRELPEPLPSLAAPEDVTAIRRPADVEVTAIRPRVRPALARPQAGPRWERPALVAATLIFLGIAAWLIVAWLG